LSFFSGGKLEYRKAQDLVLLAFRAFHSRHPEAVLVTAWHNIWYRRSTPVNVAGTVSPVPLKADGRPDMPAWVENNGIPGDRFFDLGPVPNHRIPTWLRKADVAIFPNRCEAGTNLVAMECMACGVPTILSANTGHLDIIREGICLPLHRQRTAIDVTGDGTEGWGESDVDELVEAPEPIWQDRRTASEIGARAAAHLQTMTWSTQLEKLKIVLLSV